MDANQEKRLRALAKEHTFDNVFIGNRLQNAALLAIFAGATREQFLEAAGVCFDGAEQACNRGIEERFQSMSASLAEGESSKDTCAPYDGLTAHATACTNCPTKLSPQWRVRMTLDVPEYSLICCMCGRTTDWTKDWSGLVDRWCANNPALPDGTKVTP